MKNNKTIFKSFLQGGFECTYAKTLDEERMDILSATKHDEYCINDYRLLKDLDIYTVREGLSWFQIHESKNRFNFSKFEKILKIGKEENMQQIWDLNHFDFPEFLDPFSEDFIKNFVEYSKRAVEVIRKYIDTTIFIVPINEISFFSWVSADIGGWAPYKINEGVKFKKQLVKASIAAMNALWNIDKNIRFIQVDPILRRVVNPDMEISKEMEIDFFNKKFEAWDMLVGKSYPELGGEPKYLDICGVNYYYYNQQYIVKSITSEVTYPIMDWDDKNRISFKDMLNEVYNRYNRPILITETGAWGDLRVKWWKRTFKEVVQAINFNIPILGMCSYPIIDRRDWTDKHLTNSGFWDFKEDDSKLTRFPDNKTIDIIKELKQTYML